MDLSLYIIFFVFFCNKSFCTFLLPKEKNKNRFKNNRLQLKTNLNSEVTD